MIHNTTYIIQRTLCGARKKQQEIKCKAAGNKAFGMVIKVQRTTNLIFEPDRGNVMHAGMHGSGRKAQHC